MKGIRSSSANKHCALCRVAFSLDDLERDPFVPEATDVKWFYSGKVDGWWQYDERASEEIEEAFQQKKKQVQLYIVGFLYTVDFEKMVIQMIL